MRKTLEDDRMKKKKDEKCTKKFYTHRISHCSGDTNNRHKKKMFYDPKKKKRFCDIFFPIAFRDPFYFIFMIFFSLVTRTIIQLNNHMLYTVKHYDC